MNATHLEAVAQALGEALGARTRITGSESLGGGCINDVCRIETTEGPFLLKVNPEAPAGLFGAEAAGLTALRESATTLSIPEVIAVRDEGPGPRFLVTEFLAPGRPVADFDERLGAGLAQLHETSSATGAFGFDRDNYCGATPQPNPWTKSWADFYATHRLLHQVELATTKNLLRPAERKRCDQLVMKIASVIDSDAPPALIHGDLWSGNLHRDAAGHPALIDPACYFGHPEAEFGMMLLFGGFSKRVFDAYESHAALDSGWRERVPLYQLYHLLNHLNLFGRSYAGQVMEIVKRFTS